MAGYNALNLSLTAGGTITVGNFVALTGNETVTAAGAAATEVIGVARSNAVSGEVVTVQVDGIVDAVAGAAIATGKRVKLAASNKVVALVEGTDEDNLVVGRVLKAAGADGAAVTVLLSTK